MQVASSPSRMQCQTVLAAAHRGTIDTSTLLVKVGHLIGILLTNRLAAHRPAEYALTRSWRESESSSARLQGAALVAGSLVDDLLATSLSDPLSEQAGRDR